MTVLFALLFVLCGHQGPPNYYVDFGYTPSFLILDEVGRQKDSFQFFLPSRDAAEYIVRGSELSCGFFMIVVRTAEPPSGDPCSGGWGAVIYVTSYEESDGVVSFTIPTSVTGGYSSYDVQTYHFGAWYTDCPSLPFHDCLDRGGPGMWLSSECWHHDWDGDFDVDLRDWAVIQQQYREETTL